MPRRLAQTRFPRRHNRAWAGVAATAQVVVAANTKVLLGSFQPTTSGDVTVLRTVGYLTAFSDQNTSDETQVGAFGMIVVTDTALGIGVTAIPGPVSQIADDGWFIYQPFGQGQEFSSAVGHDSVSGNTMVIDSKGKRIVEDGRSVAIMVENAHATHGMTFLFSVRMLSEVYG